MHLAYSDISCGMFQLYGLQHDARSDFIKLLGESIYNYAKREFYDPDPVRPNPFLCGIMWSDTDNLRKGMYLADQLIKEGYNVVECGPMQNPNSGNTIRAWMLPLTKEEFKRIMEYTYPEEEIKSRPKAKARLSKWEDDDIDF